MQDSLVKQDHSKKRSVDDAENNNCNENNNNDLSAPSNLTTITEEKLKRTRIDISEETTNHTVSPPTTLTSSSSSSSSTAKPGRVLHVRNLPPTLSSDDLWTICQPHGKVVDSLVLTGKTQGFVEMENEEEAQKLLACVQKTMLRVDSHTIYFQISNRTTITREDDKIAPGKVLLLTVANLNAVVLDANVIHRCLENYGNMHKIVCFHGKRDGSFKALLQFTDIETAIRVKNERHGTQLFPGCCNIFIKNSPLEDITLKNNTQDNNNRDFTIEVNEDSLANNSLLPSNSLSTPDTTTANYNNNNNRQNPINPVYNSYNVNSYTGTLRPPVPGQNNNNNNNGGFSSYFSNNDNTYNTNTTSLDPYAVQQQQTQNHNQNQQPHQYNNSYPPQPPQYGQNQFGGTHTQQYQQVVDGANDGSGCVILVNELAPGVKPFELFILFGLYGNVIRVKKLYNKEGTAMIQFENRRHAENAISKLKDCPFRGKQLQIMTSKHQTINIGNLADTGDLNGEYIRHVLHRYTGKWTSHFIKAPIPNPVIYISNIDTSDSYANGESLDMIKALVAGSFEINSTRVLQQETRTGFFIEFENTQDAAEAIIIIHNQKIGNKYLKAAFAVPQKKPQQQF